MPDWFSWGTRYERTCRPTRSPDPLGPSAPAGITKEEMLALLKENNEVSKSELKPMLDDSIAVLKMDIKIYEGRSERLLLYRWLYNPLGRPHLCQWYEYYHGEVPEGGPFGEGGAVLTDRELREAILSRLIPYVLRDNALSD
ncbi:hypothetical protein C343_00878 [Cryptococcus neoformans C23]|uniref:Uncharacterized protein n=2 Tax=Cryptococcus neoformans TaxID=5207 RepID=A0A854QKN1_CRYNE|nr:hypothetical protein CNAG_07391 [Cryptococcus neoformans var. grubii H99]AUB22476.1 hypothetical protein CKF44_07391 [Cryptococcus neoformans var. grubii]OWZ35987.1 hypothetical protein C347_00951 [Cryptococcus neoformans var. grubii AD2-60a]OWZ47750.1 hypothetical protein C343_00878 [Cryptococcus neoformans var. grubii C23]OWZ58211.1 hypothetical protein C368_01387 [Cryptococcus neoformans var. grubii 125.91]OXC86796.1 hypothetical protein C344_00885 [Cryptococcus neoformans var. grubii AD|eukprot:XP_012047070.1 hypothetical protein CNAG_07391 [Cryptococcus neoformans var. grubii H99]